MKQESVIASFGYSLAELVTQVGRKAESFQDSANKVWTRTE